jgi:predicted  nucleic acid-binding Zn-ribbon protein
MTDQDQINQLRAELTEAREELSALTEEFHTFRVKIYMSLLDVSQFEMRTAKRRERELLKVFKNFKKNPLLE